MAALPPPPVSDAYGSYVWLEWFRQLRRYITQNGSVPWSIIDFAGSTLSSIASRAHNILQSIQGGAPGEYYHLTAAEHATIGSNVVHNNTTGKQGGTTGEYYHITSAQNTSFNSGISATITLAKITTLGSDGSITFTNGIATAKVDPT